MDKKEILDILDNAKDERGAVPMRLVRQAFDKLVQPEERTEERTETHACDCISRKDAIRWIKTECNPYGKPTLDFESGKRVMKHLEQMPPAQPEQRWIPVSEMCPKKNGYYLTTTIYKQVHHDYWIDDRFDRTETVIAWMPLPEPYKGGDADG